MKLDDIKVAGVVGAGKMGFGIAINFALWGYKVVLNDIDVNILQQAVKKTQSALTMFVEEGLIDSQQANDCVSRITSTTDLEELANTSDFITEAIIERTEDKKTLFNKLDGMCSSEAIIASNTSSLVLSDIGSDVRRQDKIVLTHYFCPAHIVPGVEVAKGPGTSDETFDITYNLMKKIRKIPIRVLKEIPGYLLNRIQRAMEREVYRLWSDGVAHAEDIELGIKSTFGFRMPDEGPMMHYDLADVWKWPKNTILNMWLDNIKELEPDTADRIKRRLVNGRPWFIEAEQLDNVIMQKDRTYLRRLKEIYWVQEWWK